ncbi:SpoIIE family protein phosphatase [bacterium]|nr:SpoIIE family protein phosphatase [bacterium]
MPTQKHLASLTLSALAIACFVAWCVAVMGSLQLINKPFPGFRFEPTLTVSAVNEPTWTGIKAKLQQYDRLLRVDGHDLRTAGDLTAYVHSKPIGTPLEYELVREKRTIKVTVPSQAFGWSDWFKSFMPLFLVSFLHLLVGAVAFWMKPRHLTSQVHLLMNVAICLFCALNNDYDSGRFFAPVYLFSYSFLGSTFLHLGMVFPEPGHWLKRRPWLNALFYLPMLGLTGLWLSVFKPEGQLVNPEAMDQHFSWQDTSLMWVMVGLLVLIASILFHVFKGKTPLAKQQAKVALFGATVAYFPGAVFWIVPYLAGNTSLDGSGLLVNLSFACFVFFPLSIAYAVVRHKMFDIDLVIKRTMVYAVVVAALSGVYFITIAAIRWAIEHLIGSAGNTTGNILATAFVALAFVPVRNRTQAIIDKLFYRNRYDFRAVLSDYTRFTKENPELEAVLDKFVEVVDQTVHPRHMSIMIRDPKSKNLHVYKTSGLSIFPEDFAIPANAPEIGELSKARRTGLKPSKATTRQLSHMDALGIAFCVPLEIKGEILGMVNVGQKLSELDYTAEDQGLLMNMGQQLASVIRIHEMTKAEVNRARLDAELETARSIQASLLPTAAPAPAGLEVMGSSDSAYEFGGDYYDLVTLHDGQLRVVVGDVAGKGVQAAMVMAMAKSCFFNQVRVDPDLPTVMKAINQMIVETIDDKKHRKTTLIYGAIDPVAKTLRYTCAGHQPPHYYNAETGKVEELAIPGSFPFGASKLAKYQEIEVPLHAGDVLVFYTDGVTEAENPDHEMFYRIEDGPDGEEVVYDNLKDILEAHHHASAQEIHRQILKAVSAWVDGGPQGDDITLVVVKVQ